MRYREILEACWKGYHKEGMKTMFGKRYPNCVKNTNEEQDVAEGLIYSGDTWQDVLYRINVFNDIFGDQKDLAATFEPASQPEWIPFRDQILRSRTVLDTYAKVKQLANMNVPLTDVEIEMLDDVAWDGGGGPVEPAGHWGERDYDWLEDLYAQQFAVVQHLLDQRAQGHGQNKTKSGQTVHEQQMEEDLKKWFKEKWVRFGPDGKIRGDCARGSSKEGKPKCLPQSKAHSLGKKGRASAAAKKRREDPNPERRGAAKNVATKVREDEVKDLEKVLQNPHSYNAIDHMMQSIAKKSKITAKQLHDRFVAKHNKTPDDWIKNKGA